MDLPTSRKKRIAILGSTGSIGTQALEVIRAHPDRFMVEVLTARSNHDLLIRQAVTFRPARVVISDEDRYSSVHTALKPLGIEVLQGEQALTEVVSHPSVDLVIVSLVGFAGLLPTMAAIEAGKVIALANKETLVVAGELVTSLAKKKGVPLIPVDSEHSAIFQCMAGENAASLEKIILTASGGPFRSLTKEQMIGVTREQALNHPNWEMGAKITIDSATLMNKGLEAIEAKWLFGLQPNQIEVIIHPQSIIHSMVQFVDGSMKAQMGLPDMRLPIQYALGYPDRIASDLPRFDFRQFPNLTFEIADTQKFRNLAIAMESMDVGGNSPCIMNAANEVAVEAFLNDRLNFTQMTTIIEKTLEKSTFLLHPGLDDYIESDYEARILASSFIR